MTSSIVKYSKSFFVKILVGIITLPFIFWGMGDVFRGGNQNVIATIDSKKISTQEFMNYLNKLKLNDEQIKNLPKTSLVEEILSQYIGKKVMSLEIEKLGIVLSDNSLRDIIKNDELFKKEKKFSRTEYEKFLLKSGLTASVFEKNIVDQESRRQFINYLSGGLSIPQSLVKNAYDKENQTKSIKYIDLDKFYTNKKISNKKMREVYEKNKNIFVEELKTFKVAKITPQIIGGNEFNEVFFKKLDEIENNILDGQSFKDAVQKNNLDVTRVEQVNQKKVKSNGQKVDDISDNIFNKIFKIKNINEAQILVEKNNYYLTEIEIIKKENKVFDNPDVQKTLKARIQFENKIEANSQIIKDISLGKFNKNKMEDFSNKNKLEIKNYKILNLKQNEIFSESLIKKIFLLNDGDINLITNNNFTKNYLILIEKTSFNKIDKDSNTYEKYEAKARLNLMNKIFSTFDNDLNINYKVKLNQKTINRVKNSF